MFDKLKWVGLLLFVLYFIIFGSISKLPIFVTSLFLGATLLHEFSHCCIARIWSSDCSIEWQLSLNAGIAIYNSPYEIPHSGFKFVGGAPILSGVIGLFLTSILILSGIPIDSTAVNVIIGFSGGLIGSVSDSDDFTIRHPAAFQDFASDHDQWDPDIAESYIE